MKITSPEAKEKELQMYGLTEADLLEGDAGALVEVPAPTCVTWKRWRAANGFIASYGSFSQEFPDVTTRAQKKALRFRGEKLPYVYFEPWQTLVKLVAWPIRLFLNRFAPLPQQHQFGARVIE